MTGPITPVPLPPPPDGQIQILGLNMPPQLEVRVLEAIRGLYPTLTAGVSDTAAVQAVLRYLATQWLVQWEQRQAADPDAAVSAARSQALAAQQAAADKAATDAGQITQSIAD